MNKRNITCLIVAQKSTTLCPTSRLDMMSDLVECVLQARNHACVVLWIHISRQNMCVSWLHVPAVKYSIF